MEEYAGTPQHITHRQCLIKWRSSWCIGGVYFPGNDVHDRVTLVTMVRLFTSFTTSCHMSRCHARSCLSLLTTGLWQDAQVTLSIIKHAQGERAVHSSWAWGRVMGLADSEYLPSLWECELSFLRGDGRSQQLVDRWSHIWIPFKVKFRVTWLPPSPIWSRVWVCTCLARWRVDNHRWKLKGLRRTQDCRGKPSD